MSTHHQGRRILLSIVALVLLAASSSCKQTPNTTTTTSSSSSATSNCTVDSRRVTLDPQAAERLGVAIAKAEKRSIPRTRTIGGDVMPSSGRSIVIVSPIAGRLSSVASTSELRAGQTVRRGEAVLRLTPVAGVDRDLRAQAERSKSVADSRLGAAQAKVARTEKLLADGAASVKQLEEARAELEIAKAEVDATKSRVGMLDRAPLEADVTVTLRAPEDGVVQKVSANAQSLVPAGAPLFELVGTGSLWVKANVFVGDLRSIKADASARVRPLTAPSQSTDIEALPVSGGGPPTADPSTSTFDLYFALPRDADFRPGERVAVSVTYRGDDRALTVPEASILRDGDGAAWIYEAVASHAYQRRRVDIDGIVDGFARLSPRTTSIREGTSIVTTGCSELYGLELGASK